MMRRSGKKKQNEEQGPEFDEEVIGDDDLQIEGLNMPDGGRVRPIVQYGSDGGILKGEEEIDDIDLEGNETIGKGLEVEDDSFEVEGFDETGSDSDLELSDVVDDMLVQEVKNMQVQEEILRSKDEPSEQKKEQPKQKLDELEVEGIDETGGMDELRLDEVVKEIRTRGDSEVSEFEVEGNETLGLEDVRLDEVVKGFRTRGGSDVSEYEEVDDKSKQQVINLENLEEDLNEQERLFEEPTTKGGPDFKGDLKDHLVVEDVLMDDILNQIEDDKKTPLGPEDERRSISRSGLMKGGMGVKKFDIPVPDVSELPMPDKDKNRPLTPQEYRERFGEDPPPPPPLQKPPTPEEYVSKQGVSVPPPPEKFSFKQEVVHNPEEWDSTGKSSQDRYKEEQAKVRKARDEISKKKGMDLDIE